MNSVNYGQGPPRRRRVARLISPRTCISLSRLTRRKLLQLGRPNPCYTTGGDISELLRGRTRTESNHRPLGPPRPTTARSTEQNRDAPKLIERHPRRHPSDLRRDVSGRECIRSSPSLPPSLRKNISPHHDRRTTRSHPSSLSLFSFPSKRRRMKNFSPPPLPPSQRGISREREN